MSKINTKRILVISDQHMPYEHPDMFRFLNAVKKKYKPTCVVNIGDEADKHAMSFHDSDPELFSAGDELKEALKKIRKLEKMFPEQFVLHSNHGSMVMRKFLANGIPRAYARPLEDVYDTPGWEWHEELVLELPNGQPVYFCHGKKRDGIKLAQQYGMCVVQGHFHEVMKIDYTGNPRELIWSMQVGCLLDKKSLAYAYNKLNPRRPILGTGLIINSQPLLVPMVLDRKGRWVGKL